MILGLACTVGWFVGLIACMTVGYEINVDFNAGAIIGIWMVALSLSWCNRGSSTHPRTRYEELRQEAVLMLAAPAPAAGTKEGTCLSHRGEKWTAGTACPKCGGKRQWHDGLGSWIVEVPPGVAPETDCECGHPAVHHLAHRPGEAACCHTVPGAAWCNCSGFRAVPPSTGTP